MTINDVRTRLVNAATQYDIRQSKRPGHNPYALAQYFQAIESLCSSIDPDNGPTAGQIRTCILHWFSGRLADAMLKAVMQEKATKEEARQAGW